MGSKLPADGINSAETLYSHGAYAMATNFTKGFKLLLEAMCLNHPLATYLVGKCYYYGHGTAPDRDLAIEYLSKAVSLGVVRANFILSVVFRDDPQKAFDYCHRAAIGGDTDAQKKLADYYGNGFGVTPDNAKSRHWRKLSRQSRKTSQPPSTKGHPPKPEAQPPAHQG